VSSQGTERLVVIVVVTITAAISLPIYPKLVAKITARGIELSWLHHVGLFALAVLLGLVGMALVGLMVVAVTWAADGASQLLRRLQNRRRQMRMNPTSRNASNIPTDPS
jgi:hypothetical protein